MQLDRWQRVKEVFDAAVELDTAARKELLERLCGTDIELRQEVMRLLEADALSPVEDAGEDVAREAFQVGEVLAGRFHIEALIGSGGMGEVYRAHDAKLDERVAIKAIHPEFLGERRFRERFRREMQLARQVAHPNICRIHDLVEDAAHPGAIAFTMELVEGSTLAQYLAARGPLHPDDALPILRQICQGLDALHAEGIVHRDLKPGNVILSTPRSRGNGIAKQPDGSKEVAVVAPPLVKITDFGLARRVAEPDQTRSGVTNTRDVVGTPRYMAPEQLMGGQVTAAADIYALGVLIYELLTGQSPYPAEGVGENVVQKTTVQPALPSQLVPSLSAEWDAVLLRCLQPDAAKRPGRATDVVAALSDAAPRVVRRPGKRTDKRMSKPRPWRRQVPTRALVASVAMMGLLFGLLAWALWSGVELTPSKRSGRALMEPGSLQRVAVLPFDTVGGSDSMRAIAAGLTDVITKGLSRYEGVNQELSVVAASEVRRSGVRDAATAFKMLGADRCIEGTLEVGGQQLRLILTIVDGENLHQLSTAEVIGSEGQWTELRRGSVQSIANMMGLQYPAVASQTDREPVPGAEVWYLQGLSYLQGSPVMEELPTAYQLLQKAVEADSDFALAHAGLGETAFRLWEQGRDPDWMTKAIAHCRRALAVDPTLPEARITLGMILRGTGKYEQSLAEFDEVLRQDPRNADAFKCKADTYTAMGTQYDQQALATYHRALELRPADAEFYLWLGNFHIKRKNYEDALRSYQNVMAMLPDNPKPHTNTAALLMMQDRYEEAIPLLRKALDLAPSNAAAMGNMGFCLLAAKDYARATTYFEQAMEQKPNDFKIVAGLANAYGWMHDPREVHVYRTAIRLLEKELQLNPKRDDFYILLANYHAGAGDGTEAVRWLRRAARHSTITADDQARMASIYARLDMRPEALQWARKARAAGYKTHQFERFQWLQALLKDPEFPTQSKAS